MCNIIEDGQIWGIKARIIYRHYATLYFIFIVDRSESELGTLDLIQIFVEALDQCFGNVCELDLIFNPERAYQILDEIIMSGIVQETSLKSIVHHVKQMDNYINATKTSDTPRHSSR